MQNPENYTIEVDVRKFVSESQYRQELQQQILLPSLRNKLFMYHIKWNIFFTEKIGGAFTERSFQRLSDYINRQLDARTNQTISAIRNSRR
jgi:hypothetical protein